MRLVAVLGYSGRRAGRLHPVCAARLDLAARVAEAGDVVVLTGWARRAGSPPEAELMRRSWRGPGCELVCDSESRITAENAAYVARLARDLGAREVVVVTSWWHRLRTGLLFRALVRGLPVSVVASRRPAPLPLLLREVAAFAVLPRQLARVRRTV